MKIYTKTGDKGKTALLGGTKVPKNHIRIESYGTIDELNSYVGWVAASVEDEKLQKLLHQIQERLFTIGSSLAADPEKTKMALPDLRESDILLLEKEIDRMEEALTPLKTFILPGGSQLTSLIHVARCVCRRAERKVVYLSENHFVEPLIVQYLNRLSDYLFVFSRYCGHLKNTLEIPWNPSGR